MGGLISLIIMSIIISLIATELNAMINYQKTTVRSYNLIDASNEDSKIIDLYEYGFNFAFIMSDRFMTKNLDLPKFGRFRLRVF